MKKKNKIPQNQFDALEKWLDFYKENQKLPYNQVLCCECKTFYASLKGAGMRHALKNSGNNIEVLLKSTRCKDCKCLTKKQEPKRVAKKIKTQEEREQEIEQIRRDMPKINLDAPRTIIDLKKNPDLCAVLTHSSCIRPDIYLDNDRSCDYCSINEYCACPIKRFAQKRKSYER